VTSLGITFEVIQLIRVPTENGIGMKLIIGERFSVDRERIKGGMRVGKRKRGESGAEKPGEGVKKDDGSSAFVLESKELRDMFIYSK
jgi:mediator of RNA polymerase II transcription subunit 14